MIAIFNNKKATATVMDSCASPGSREVDWKKTSGHYAKRSSRTSAQVAQAESILGSAVRYTRKNVTCVTQRGEDKKQVTVGI